jgi:L-asparagine transporter-like permease
MPLWLRATLSLLAYAAALAALWFLVDDSWASVLAIAVSMTIVTVSAVRRYRSGEPWFSKDPDDYR